MQSRNLAARAGRWSAHHKKTAIFGWIAFVIAALVIGNMVGTKQLTDAEQGTGQSGRADRVVDDAFPKKTSESVLVQSGTLKADDPAFRRTVRDVERRLGANRDVKNLDSPYAKGNEGQVSKDGKSVLVNFEVLGTDTQTEKKIDAILATTSSAQKANPDFRVEEFGGASADKALSKSFDDDFQKAEKLSVPITLVILLFAFGALVAAGLPLLVGLTSVAAAIGLVGLVSQVAPVSDVVNSVILLIGLAVGVDYCLFYIRREREERAAGRGEEAALEAAAATSGRAVLISGLTVMIAMAGMYITGDATFSSMATGTIMVVAISVLGSVTFLPAMLAALGDRINRGRIPFLGRRRNLGGESRFWGAFLDRVLKRPVVSIVVAGGILIALAVPALGLNTQVSGVDDLPRDLPVMQTYDRIQAAFPGGELPATVVVHAKDVTDPTVSAQVKQLTDDAMGTGKFNGTPTVDVSPDKTVATVDLPIQGDGQDAKSLAGLAALRDDVIPATTGRLDGVDTYVTGQTAGSKDFNDLMSSKLPLVFAFVLGAAFLLLLVTFRSIVIPIKAIVLNLLSVAAAYGVLVLVFQDGVGKDLLGFDNTGPITSWLPLFLFVVLFGLSMDYHVFILTRIREAFDKGEDTSDAVAHGIKSTASVVTSAAVVMVAVFSIFATLSAIEFKQMGVGLAAAILIDATIVRAVLLPATMKLLGDWNWYLPKRLDWLPRLSHEGSVDRRPAPEGARA